MNRESERKRLVELIRAIRENATITCPRYIEGCGLDTCNGCQYDMEDGSCNYAEREADYLLANGIVVPPCKFGDTIYVIPSKANRGINVINGFAHLNRVYEQKISKIEIYANNKYMLTTCDGMQSVHCDLYGETWFLSREEAEKMLKGEGEK